MSLNSRSGTLMAAFAALLATNAACSKSSTKSDAGPDGVKDQVGEGQVTEHPDTITPEGGEVAEVPPDTTDAKDAKPPEAPDAMPPEPPDAKPPEPPDAKPPEAPDAMPPEAPDAMPPEAPDAMPPDTNPCAALPAASKCTMAGDVQCSADGSAVQTCGADANGCLVWSDTTTCKATMACTGTGASSACACKPAPTSCGSVTNGTVCSDSKTQVTCATDADGCVSATTVTCSTNKTCQGAAGSGACACGGGTLVTCNGNDTPAYCIDSKTKGICSMTADGCYIVTDQFTCGEAQTCQGPDGSGYCGCPLRPDQVGYDKTNDGKAGTGCLATDAASSDAKVNSRCDSTTGNITKCMAVGTGTSACYVWVAQPACSTGLSCTTDGTNADNTPVNAPHCGCADVLDGNFYADPLNGHDAQWTVGGVSVKPTGSNNSAQCRFKTLFRALTATMTDGGTTGPGANAWAGHDTKLDHQYNGDGQPNGTTGKSVAPILLTLQANHDLKTGNQIVVSGVLGNTSANGTFTVNTGTDCSTGTAGSGHCQTWELELQGTIGNGDYAVINGETNTAPITFTTSTDHNLNTGDHVTIYCSNGNSYPPAAGSWTVTKVDTTHFTLNTSAGNGTYCSNASLHPHITPAGTHTAAKVIGTGAAPVIFSAEPKELPVNDRVSVVGGDGTTPADYILQGGIAGGRFVVLTGQGSFDGFTINNNVPAGMIRPHAALYCQDPGSGTRAFHHLVVNGKGPKTGSNFTRQRTGLRLANDCVATADDVVIGGPDVVGDTMAQDDENGYFYHGVLLDRGQLSSSGGLIVRNTIEYGVNLYNSHGWKVDKFETTGAILSNNGSGLFQYENSTNDTFKYENVYGYWDGSTPTGPIFTMHGGSVDNAGCDGIELGSAVVTLNTGTVVKANGLAASCDGIDAYDVGTPRTVPSLTTDTTVDINGNYRGVSVVNWLVSMTGTHVHGSTGSYGIEVNNTTKALPTPAFTVSLTSVEVDHNDLDGIYIYRADRTNPDLAKLVTIDSAKIHDNGITATDGGGGGILVGNVVIAPSCSPEASVLLVSSTVNNNGLSGVHFRGSCGNTHESLQDSDINSNHTLKSLGVGDPDTNAAGVLFETSSTLTGATGNKFHNNLGPEVRFMANARTLCGNFGNAACPATNPATMPWDPAWDGSWDLTPLSKTGCDDTSNQIYCYNEASDIGVGTQTGVYVLAKWVHWRNMSPAAGREYSIAGNVDASSPCTAIATCP